MWAGIGVVLLGSVAAGGVLRALSWGRRRRMTQSISPDAILLETRGTSLRVLVSGVAALPSMSTTKANRTLGDVVVTRDRLLVVCSRGTLVDIRPGRGRALDSVRSPGPGRLILEGSVPSTGGEAGSYRIELVVNDSPTWLRALLPFRTPDNGGFGEALTA